VVRGRHESRKVPTEQDLPQKKVNHSVKRIPVWLTLILSGLAVFLSFPCFALTQGSSLTGAIQGTVSDSSGGAVEGATVTDDSRK